ncbi:NACHT domain-containing protein [Metapseudomonas sp. CR1201]
MENLDINAVTADLVRDFTKEIVAGVHGLGRDALSKLKVNLNLCLQKYLERSHERYSKTKTLLYRERPVSIKEFYVRTDLGIGGRVVEEREFLNRIKEDKRIIVSGTAGSGKSTFCKSTFIEIIESSIGVMPIFVELRQLNTDQNSSLVDYIIKALAEIEPTFTRQQFEYALSVGKMLLIFDGFDEIDSGKREVYEREILGLSSKYNEIMIVISSRPDSRFSSWEEFYKYEILGLDKEKAKSLIGKLEYDRSVKRKFLAALDESLYDKHKSFASTPLLLTMMLLTYEQIAEIPNKIHLFYEQAFLTLFNKHDSLKSLYKRKSFSGLPLDEFRRILSIFSALSYSEKKYFFYEEELLGFLRNAVRISDIKAYPEPFLNDLLDSVCIMQRDGVGFTFTHRSFQEYFTALFLVNFPNEKQFDIFDKIAFTNDRDDVISMAYDINSDLVERVWIMPRLKSFIEELSSIPESPLGRLEMLKRLYSNITLHYSDDDDEPGIAFTLYRTKNSHPHFFHLLSRIWSKEFSRLYAKKSKDKSELEIFYEKELIEKDLVEETGEGVNLKNLAKIRKETKVRILNSGCWKIAFYYLQYARIKLKSLERKHSKKESDLTALILGGR